MQSLTQEEEQQWACKLYNHQDTMLIENIKELAVTLV